MEDGSLSVQILGRGFAAGHCRWHESLHEVVLVRPNRAKHPNPHIVRFEEIAWRNGWLLSDGRIGAA